MITETGRVVSNQSIANNIWRMDLNLPQIVRTEPQPGQFLEILINPSWERPLRRPMSIAGINAGSLSLIYKILGSSTRELSHKQPGDTLQVIGPLGNSFSQSATGLTPVLVAGGVGLPPILWLHQNLLKQNINHYLIIGAQTGDEHFLTADERHNIYLATDDGSLGRFDTVIPVLIDIINKCNNIYVYSCGPEAMLEAVQATAARHKIAGQLSTESYMACGFGVCQGCVIRRSKNKQTEHSFHSQFALVCKDGPVFEFGEIKFD